MRPPARVAPFSILTTDRSSVPLRRADCRRGLPVLSVSSPRIVLLYPIEAAAIVDAVERLSVSSPRIVLLYPDNPARHSAQPPPFSILTTDRSSVPRLLRHCRRRQGQPFSILTTDRSSVPPGDAPGRPVAFNFQYPHHGSFFCTQPYRWALYVTYDLSVSSPRIVLLYPRSCSAAPHRSCTFSILTTDRSSVPAAAASARICLGGTLQYPHHGSFFCTHASTSNSSASTVPPFQYPHHGSFFCTH